MQALCRDCNHYEMDSFERCPKCGSQRTVQHVKLRNFAIAHIDCDAFFAAIEKRDNPELRDKPVIVGGGKRGVVATCCYLARLHGVRSAMPMFKALKACPEAVVVKPRREAYSQASAEIRTLFEQLTPLVQMISIDEGYLDLSGTETLNDAFPALALSRTIHTIENKIGITVSVGLSDNKFLAKTASELDKPRGFAVLGSDEAPAFLAPRPIGFLHGVGKQQAAKLAKDGYKCIGDLQSVPQRQLIQRYGETGLWLHRRAFGIDTRPVRTDSIRKSVSAERTFDNDISDAALLEDRLWQVCEETAMRAKRHSLEGGTLTLKLKTKNFRTLTRSTSLTSPTHLANQMFRIARPMLARETGAGQAYRLIGISLSHLSDARWDSRDLIDPMVEKRAKAERAGDAAREKFGKTAIMTGRSMRQNRS